MSVFEDIKIGLNQAIEYEKHNKHIKNEEIIKAFEHFVSQKGEGVILYDGDGSMVRLQDIVDLIHGQKAEIERLTEDNKRLNELLVGGTEVIDYWNNKYLEEQAKNAELQKQVDELKVRNEKLLCEIYGVVEVE